MSQEMLEALKAVLADVVKDPKGSRTEHRITTITLRQVRAAVDQAGGQ